MYIFCSVTIDKHLFHKALWHLVTQLHIFVENRTTLPRATKLLHVVDSINKQDEVEVLSIKARANTNSNNLAILQQECHSVPTLAAVVWLEVWPPHSQILDDPWAILLIKARQTWLLVVLQCQTRCPVHPT